MYKIKLVSDMGIKDWHILLAIYFLTLGITLYHAICSPIISDRLLEYNVYLSQIQSGRWQFITDSIINSCLFVTYIPALIQRLTNLDAEMIFRIYPCIFYSLMPLFSYLIARKYFNKVFSLLVSLLIITNFYILYTTNLGRVSIAWAFFAGIIYAFLYKRYALLGLFLLLIVFTHYGTAYIALSSLFVLCVAILFYKNVSKPIVVITCFICVVSIIAIVWYFFMARSIGGYTMNFVTSIINTQPISDNISSDAIVKQALGANYGSSNIPQKIEFYSNWIIIISIVLGYLVSLKTKVTSWEHNILAFLMFSFIGITMISPYISRSYGIARVYFTALPIIAPYFVVFWRYVFKNKLLSLIIPYGIVIVNGLCTSGLLHRIFGIIK